MNKFHSGGRPVKRVNLKVKSTILVLAQLDLTDEVINLHLIYKKMYAELRIGLKYCCNSTNSVIRPT